ncbi:MAG: hypothetical protein QFB87_01390 [Patescibacteria group bacterium]|nr:hypothetical protein [Patescibacteria group bacterium]
MKNILPPKVSNSVNETVSVLVRYKLIIFVLLVAGVYGYIVLTISSLANAQPTADQISAESRPIKSTKIDKQVILQLQQLQDNSVSVKTLFNEARDNPFQEN